MALLRRIDARDRYWRRNRQLHVEPTEEQKIIAQKEEQERRRRLREMEMKFSLMFLAIDSWCPGVVEKSMRMAKMIK